MTKFRPLLAATLEPEDIATKLNYPALASPKLDGIRIIIMDGKVLTRSLKPLPNSFIQSILGRPELNGLDGEIIVGDPTDPLVFRKTTSAVRREDGEPDFKLYVFDNFLIDAPFKDRLMELNARAKPKDVLPYIEVLDHKYIEDRQALDEYEVACITAGYEGVMLRLPSGPYKHGRSTLNEGILLKLKRFQHEEATILDMVERFQNDNEVKINALGYKERSSHKENRTGRGDLGALVVKCLKTGVEFNIGTGFTDDERKDIWERKEQLIGSIIKYKFMGYGEYDAPRFPVYEGFRIAEDMSAA